MRAVAALGLGLALVTAGCATGDTDASGAAASTGGDGASQTEGDGAPVQETEGGTSSTPVDGGGAPSVDATLSDSGASSETGDATTGAADATDAASAIDSAPSCVNMDAGCTTTNPGACAAGTLLCDGGAATCEPIATTQSCYTGTASTLGKGICKAGTQSCIATLGTCTGEVLPAPIENCFNTLDDDCDGVVNNGCPASLALGPDTPLTAAGGGGGGAGSVHCPTGAFVTRVDSWFDDSDKHASGVSIYCATPALVQGASAYTVSLTPNTPAPYAVLHGSNDPADERTDDCGITGLTAISYVTGLGDSFVEGLGAHCGTSEVTLSATNTITFDFTNNGDMSFNSYSGGGGTAFDQACGTNAVVVGFNLRTGDWMDGLAAVCATLTVVSQ